MALVHDIDYTNALRDSYNRLFHILKPDPINKLQGILTFTEPELAATPKICYLQRQYGVMISFGFAFLPGTLFGRLP